MERMSASGNPSESKPRLKEIGAERLTKEQMLSVKSSFAEHLRAGLEGRASSLATIPTFLEPVDYQKLIPGQQALVVEVGGTNIYGGLVVLDEEKNPQLVADRLVPLSKERNRKYTSAKEFYGEIAASVAPLLADADPLGVGIIWSFPAKIEKTPEGIDARSPKELPKEFVIPGVDEGLVGTALLDELHIYNPNLSSEMPRAVANDTAAVLLANGGTIGGIVGTGFNFAFVHNGALYNLEAGGFSGVPQTKLTKEINDATDQPDKQLAEKQIAGDYVGQLYTAAIKHAGIANKTYTAQDMSAILAGQNSSVENYDVMREIAENLRDRSAQILSSMVAGAIETCPEDFPTKDIVIPIEGSFFAKTPGYKEAVELYVAQLVGEKHVAFRSVSQSGMKGAALAALSIIR